MRPGFETALHQLSFLLMVMSRLRDKIYLDKNHRRLRTISQVRIRKMDERAAKRRMDVGARCHYGQEKG